MSVPASAIEEITVGLSLMPDPDFEVAAAPLFDDDLVETVEWSFDMGWGRQLSPWLESTLQHYSQLGQLLGHGVSYSALDASETPRQSIWLQQLQQELETHSYSHISEHFGFLGGGNFHFSAPLPVPRTPTSVQVGVQRLRELSEVAKVPVGLENLAFAFGRKDLEEQGPFLEELLRPVNGFLLLDLHNLYCQSYNFGVGLLDLVRAYPLELVREIHVSGGTFAEHPAESGNQIRRDTHDDRVPETLFEILPEVIALCPNLRTVIMERLGGTIDLSREQDDEFQADFRRLRSVVIHGWS